MIDKSESLRDIVNIIDGEFSNFADKTGLSIITTTSKWAPFDDIPNKWIVEITILATYKGDQHEA